MPGITRRSSERDDIGEDSSPASVESSNKRVRLSARVEGGSDDVPDTPSQHGSNVDDSWALTPPRSVRHNRERTKAEHLQGQIVRVTMKDFVTYSQATFFPGPTLNMVIGPNGTGKSTLVCAICLGLGWGPQHLGRASNISEFVKKGRPEARIEIELKGKAGRANRIFRRVIKAEGNKTSFSIDGETVSNKKVLECARSFNIQVDNLCHFLPQDRVVEFSRLEPVERLASTLQAAADPQVIQWHESLKSQRNEQRRLEKERASLQDQLTNLRGRQEAQRQDVERLRGREELRNRISMLEKTRPMAEFYAKKQEAQTLKAARERLTAEIKFLKQQSGPASAEYNEKEAYRQATFAALDKRQKFAARFEKHIQRLEEQRRLKDRGQEDLKRNKINAKESDKKIQADIAKHKTKLRGLESDLLHEPPEFNPAEYNEKIRQREREITGLESEMLDMQEAGNQAASQVADFKNQIRTISKDIEDMQSKAGQQTSKLKEKSPDTFRAWEWIQENQARFSGEVYGPPVVTCHMSDMRHADTVESLMQRSEFVAITCTNSTDFKLLQNQLYGVMKLHDITLRTMPNSGRPPPPLNVEEMRQYGVQNWAIDFLEGPAPVLAMLCGEVRLHATAVFGGDLSDQQYQQLVRGEKLSNWIAGKSIYKIQRRREYNATSTAVRTISPAKWWTEKAVDGAAVNEKKYEIEQLQSEVNRLETEQAQRTELRRKKRSNIDQLKGEKNDIEDEKAEKQRELGEYRTIPTKINATKTALDTLATAARDNEQSVKDIYKQQSDLMIAKGQLTMDILRQVGLWRQASENVVVAKIALAEAESEEEMFKQKLLDAQRGLEDKEKEFEEAQARFQAAHSQAKQLKKAVEKIKQDEPEVHEYYSELEEHEQKRMPQDLEAEIESHRARLELLAGGNEGAVVEWEERGRRIESLENKAIDLDSTLAALQRELDTTRALFEPQVDGLVAHISSAFAASFARINCAGSVEIHKHGENGADFDAWAVNILVSFRGGEAMSALDSHRQSGGERAVSTIFYLMALQSLSRAPFRVVDEINQGMDPRNERVVHERLVDLACGADTTSQYFLVTPKLLSGLHYRDGMKVHCIASGQYMPSDAATVDFRALVTARREQNLASRQRVDRAAEVASSRVIAAA